MLGSIGPYSESEDFEIYAERVNLYFEANEIPDGKQVPAFLTFIGPKAYAILRSLVSPTPPKDKTFEELLTALKNHYCPKPLVIVERFRFLKKYQAEGESISTFTAELKKLSAHCNFGANLAERLRDQFVVGVRNEHIQRKLLTVKDLTFPKTVEISTSMEMADKDSRELTGASNKVQYVERKKDGWHKNSPTPTPNASHKTKSSTFCYRCGNPSHKADKCSYKDSVCHSCGKPGHLQNVCFGKSPQKPDTFTQARNSSNYRQPKKKFHKDKKVNLVESSEHEVAEPVQSTTEDTYQLFAIQKECTSTTPFITYLQVNGVNLPFEIDTGSAVTLISEFTFKRILADKVELKPSKCTLRTYTGEPLQTIGTCDVEIIHKKLQYTLPLLVVQGQGPSLIGRDWLSVIQLDWHNIGRGGFKGNVYNVTVDDILNKYPEVLKEGLGTLKGVKGHLVVDSNAEPVFFKPRTVPYALRDRVNAELDRLYKEGIIEPVSFSDWAAPIVPVVKSDGNSVRICGDFKVTINRVARVEKYPLPRVDDLYAKLSGGQKFTKLDLQNAYLQVELDEQSKRFVTINTQKGLFRYNRLPFGVSSAPAIFQRIMDQLIGGMPFVCASMDDILITGRNNEEHLKNVDEVLRRLTAAGLKLNRAKCVFMAPEVVYLGFRIDSVGLHPVKEKIEAIANAPAPRDITELRSYLGGLNYYAKFIPNLSSELKDLHILLGKNIAFTWGKKQNDAFIRSKEILLSTSVLIHYDPSKELILSTDASPYGLGAVLAHRLPDGTERPINFASRTLIAAERNYSQLEKEALSIVWGVKKFHQYLFGRNFTIYNDHRPLESLLSETKPIPPMASGRIQRWALTLSAYQYSLRYRCGEKMANADAMSRLPLPITVQEVPVPAETVCLIEFMDSSPIDVDHIRRLTDRDPVLSRVKRFVGQGWSTVSDSDELKPYFIRKDELSLQDGCLLWGARVVVPKAARERVLEMLHEAHPGIVRMKCFARKYVWWPKMDQNLESKVRGCDTCQKSRHAPPKALLHPWEYPSRAWSRIHIDFAGPYQGKMLLIIVDAYTKWVEVHVMNSSTAEATVDKLRQSFATFGIPDTVVSDNATNFCSEIFQTFMSRNGIKHIKVAPKHPASNGLAERTVQSVKEGIGRLSSGSMETKVARYLFKYRNTPHCTTGKTPAELMFNRQVKTHLDLLHPDSQSRVTENQFKQKVYHDAHAKDRSFEVGDTVYVTNFSSGPCWLPGIITVKTGPVSYIIQISGGRSVRRHQDHIRLRSNDTGSCDVVPAVLGDGHVETEIDNFILPNTDSNTVSNTDSNIDLNTDSNTDFDANATCATETVNVTAPVLRRSSRVCKAPERMDV